MNVNNISVLLLVIILSPKVNFSQSDTSKINPNEMILSPSFWGFQIEAVSVVVSSEFGVLLDYDLYSSQNKKYNFGLRLSTEYYEQASLDVGGKSLPGPFWDFNVYGRHSIRGKSFWFSPLLGFSLHSKLDEGSSESKLLLKWGLELKYNLLSDNVGLLFKLAGAFSEKVGYAGVGLSFGMYNNK
jgi:hypothetical protein